MKAKRLISAPLESIQCMKAAGNVMVTILRLFGLSDKK